MLTQRLYKLFVQPYLKEQPLHSPHITCNSSCSQVIAGLSTKIGKTINLQQNNMGPQFKCDFFLLTAVSNMKHTDKFKLTS